MTFDEMDDRNKKLMRASPVFKQPSSYPIKLEINEGILKEGMLKGTANPRGKLDFFQEIRSGQDMFCLLKSVGPESNIIILRVVQPEQEKGISITLSLGEVMEVFPDKRKEVLATFGIRYGTI